MFPDVATFLACKDFKGKFVLVSDSQVNGNFMIQHFLVQALKSSNTIVYLLSFGQLLVHYNTIASKLGVNVAKCISSGQLHFVDCLTQLLPSNSSSGSHSNTDCDLKSKVDASAPLKSYSVDPKNISLKSLYLKLKAEVDEELSKGNYCCIIIDNYSVLLSLGADLSHLVDFIHYLRVMLCSSNMGGPLVVMTHCDEDVDDEEERLLRDHLSHVCHMHINVTGLQTGFSRDIHGELKVKWCEDHSVVTRQERQFKVTDRNVQLFSKGTSSAVL